MSSQKEPSDSASTMATASTSTVPGVITEEWTESSTLDTHAEIASQNVSSTKITSSKVKDSPCDKEESINLTSGPSTSSCTSSSHGQAARGKGPSSGLHLTSIPSSTTTAATTAATVTTSDEAAGATSTSLSSDAPQHFQRSPTPSSLAVTLQVPSVIKSPLSPSETPLLSTQDLIFADETVVINRYKQLATAVFGLMKSFSTSDITLESSEQQLTTSPIIRSAVSESFLNPSTSATINQSSHGPGAVGVASSHIPIRIIGDIYSPTKLDYNCRSISTWVAVGDVANNSQIPSPVTHTAESIVSSIAPSISPMYLVKSVNKKIRRMYIKRRIISTYKALERMSRSQLDLTTNTLTPRGHNATWNPLSTSPSTLSISAFAAPTGRRSIASIVTAVDAGGKCNLNSSPPTSPKDHESTSSVLKANLPKSDSKLAFNNLFGEGVSSLTSRDIDLQKGKPLSKYDRNMIIFNWLQELDEPPIPDQLLST